MFTSTTPFKILSCENDENNSSLRKSTAKPGLRNNNDNNVKKRGLSSGLGDVPSKISDAPVVKSIGRKALGDLSSSQINVRTAMKGPKSVIPDSLKVEITKPVVQFKTSGQSEIVKDTRPTVFINQSLNNTVGDDIVSICKMIVGLKNIFHLPLRMNS